MDADLLYGQLRARVRASYGQAAGMWLGVSFPNTASEMIGSTVVIGTQADGVQFYAWEADFASAIIPLDNSWQTLTDTMYSILPNGETVLQFTKRLDENEYDLQRSSDQPVLDPHRFQADLILAVGNGAEIDYQVSAPMTFHDLP